MHSHAHLYTCGHALVHTRLLTYTSSHTLRSCAWGGSTASHTHIHTHATPHAFTRNPTCINMCTLTHIYEQTHLAQLHEQVHHAVPVTCGSCRTWAVFSICANDGWYVGLTRTIIKNFSSFFWEQGFDDKVCESSRTLELFEQFDVQFRKWRTLPVSVVILVHKMLV
jgi:hypothetical protein